MSGTSVRFTEGMTGHVTFGEHDHQRGAAFGRQTGDRLTVGLTIVIDDLDRFVLDPNREAHIAGWVDWEALGGRLPIERGTFNLLVGADDSDRKRMRYRLFFRDGVGHPVTLAGEKLVGAPGLRVWSDTTTLYVRVLSGRVEAEDGGGAEIIALGILHLRPLDFARQLTTFRASGRSPAARVRAIARFDAFFARLLWRAYGPPLLRRLRATLPTPTRRGPLLGARRVAKGDRGMPAAAADRDPMATPPPPDGHDRASPPNHVRRLPDDTRIVFFSDSHIGGDPGHDIFESPMDLVALLDELADLDGPVELVLAGDFFDFLQIGEVPPGEDRASLTVARPEYRTLFATLRRFAAGAGRRVVYLPGNHDAEVWWNPAIRQTLRREGLVHEFALSYAACFASRPNRIVYCEHGNQFDPANAITDYDDPLDTPIGHHIVTDVLRRVVPGGTASGDGNPALRDVNKVYPLVTIPELLAGRLFYDLLTQIVRWVLVPLFLAYAAFRLVAYAVTAARDDPVPFSQSYRTLPGAQRLFLEIGYDAALLLTAFGTMFFVVRRLAGRFVSTTAERLPGLPQPGAMPDPLRHLLESDRPMPMGHGLTGRDVSVFVSGHTHAPSLTELARDRADPAVVVNSGCWLRQLRPIPAHGGGPAVFVSTFVLTHVRVSRDDRGVRVELWEHPKPARLRLRLAERIAVLGRLPTQPPAHAEPRIVAATALTTSPAPPSIERPG